MSRPLVAVVLSLLVLLPCSLLAQETSDTPPLAARYETPRSFGYHIGDLIPLILAIEAKAGTVVDLESLPRAGETAGLLEIRTVRIDRSDTASASVYRIAFTLQAFVPATWALAVIFPSLELRVALPEERLSDGGYVYRTVSLPPYQILLSPTVRGSRELRANKGSVLPELGWTVWGPLLLGGVFTALGLGRATWDLVAWYRRRRALVGSPAEQKALRALRVLRDRYAACEEKTSLLFMRATGVLRRFLREECGIPAGAQTVPQIKERFKGHPLEGELTELLEHCNEVLYDGRHPGPSEKDAVIRELTALISRLAQAGCPAAGGNGAPR